MGSVACGVGDLGSRGFFGVASFFGCSRFGISQLHSEGDASAMAEADRRVAYAARPGLAMP